MRRWISIWLFVGCIAVSLLAGTSEAAVNVGIGIALPQLAITAAPALVVIPGSSAYVAPEVEVGLFFSNGSWYRPYQGGWYVSAGYNGPWGSVAIGSVPPAIIGYSRDGYESRDAYPANGRGRGMGMGMMGRGMGMR